MADQDLDVRRISGGLLGRIEAITPVSSRGRLARWARLLPRIAAYEPQYQKLSDHELKKESLSLRYRARSGEPLPRLLPEAYALVREAGRRTVGMRHFDVQVLGGIAMFYRSIVEMQTGEGKTLTATLPMYLYALAGKGCNLATVNDDLGGWAEARPKFFDPDTGIMAQVFANLGIQP